MLITFSGLDGSGKSTLISLLTEWFHEEGGVVAVRSTYYHLGLYATIRRIRDSLAKPAVARLIGQELRPNLETTDPDRLGLTLARHGPLLRPAYALLRSGALKKVVLLIDVPILLAAQAWYGRSRRHILIMDRYVYDSLADAADGKHWGFVRAFLRLMPEPDCAVFVDVDPAEALRRKGEYSVTYNARRRRKYEEIFSAVKSSVRISNEVLSESRDRLIAEVSARWVRPAPG